MHKIEKEKIQLSLWCESGHRRLGYKIYFSEGKFRNNLNSISPRISGFQ